ncbi:MAG: ribulose-phosphate 3-epimerase [Thermodesulfobacteriota bacterium]|nr:ribulose-phosphate 3-epimerase [Thermodesulfobacteriota bacterium]
MRIVPAILTETIDDLHRMLDIAKSFTDYAQIDFMDGKFVPSKSVSFVALDVLKLPLNIEAHLMVQDLNTPLATLKSIGTKKVIFHFEAAPQPKEVISNIRNLDMEVGLAINPETPIADFEFLVSQVDSFLFLSVNPGYYGSPFIYEVLDEISRFRNRFPSAIIGIDGGVSLDNIVEIKEIGVDYACVGSRILLTEDPKESYKAFLRITEEEVH